jgi:hypothetical protein
MTAGRTPARLGSKAGAGAMNPNVYFSIGDAIAGLGIFLLIPQYLKPIYVFRLRVLGIGLRWIYALPGLGFLCVLTAALTSEAPSWVPVFLRTPLLWEIMGGMLYAISYSALAWVYIFPARSGRRSLANYARAGTKLLAGATEEDRVELAADILANIRKLIRVADAKAASDPDKAAAARTSATFLNILSEPVFCRTLVARLPNDAARILQAFAQEHPSHQVGKSFVLQITRQVLLACDVGESERHGFADGLSLPQVAFGDRYLNRHYVPWEAIDASDFDDVDSAKMERVLAAAKLTIDEQMASGLDAPPDNIVRLQESFEVLSRRIAQLRRGGADVTPLANTLGQAVKYIVETARTASLNSRAEEAAGLYADVEAVRDFTVLDAIAELLMSVLENTSYDFAGYDDKFWAMARQIWDAILPRFGTQHAGMDPLQQRFALKLSEKLRESMEGGWYSPISRQALAIIGPYAARGESKERTAFKICRDAVYRELRALPEFYEKDPERAKSFLPDNVRYERETAELIHRYSFGGEDRTRLNALEVPAISLTGEAVAPSGFGRALAKAS